MTLLRKTTPASTYQSRRATLENLEGRTLFAAAPPVVTAEVVGNELHVTGTRLSDNITVALNGSDLEVRSNDAVVGTFALAGLNGLSVDGGNGHDTIAVHGSVSLLATLLGGNGRDTLVGGSGQNHMEGGNGNDSLTGGSAGDELDGGNGKDVLLGMLGNDTLLGGNGRDTLDGGEGDDSLTGGRARDAVTGGLGADSFNGDRAIEVLDHVEGEVLVEPVRARH
ncbi:MAG TPA: calcium-binding protein [Tepidisphaeraceae bacterium]|nr:calcium-binding protein [Tepidisphaeraceae bacterium]